MPSFRFPQPPQEPWVRRAILVVASVVVLAAAVLAFKGGSSTNTADDEVVPTTWTVAPDVTTTTADPKAIQAGVANLLAHDGPTPQELAAVPANAGHGGSGSHHSKAGGSHTKH